MEEPRVDTESSSQTDGLNTSLSPLPLIVALETPEELDAIYADPSLAALIPSIGSSNSNPIIIQQNLSSPLNSPRFDSSPSFDPPIKVKKTRTPSRPIKSILKPPVVTNQRFSFKRDILQPFKYASSSATSSSMSGQDSMSSASSLAVIANVGSNAASMAGGFFSSQFRKLNTTTTTGGAGQGKPDARMSRLGSNDGKSEWRNGGVGSNVHAAPNTPSRGIATSSVASTSSVATIRSPSTSSSRPTSVVVVPQQLSVGELKKVSFRMANLKVVYPINNGPNGPITPSQERLTKRRVNSEYRGARLKSQQKESNGWTGQDLGRLYTECCRTREEFELAAIRNILQEHPTTPPRTIDLSNIPLSRSAVETLSDLLSVNFGLKKLILENCGLDDQSLKPLLHALLVSGNVPTISIANNKKIKIKGWKLIAIFLRKAKFLRYLDLSENTLDQRAVDYLVQAITSSDFGPDPSPRPAHLPTASIIVDSSSITSSPIPSSEFVAPTISPDEAELITDSTTSPVSESEELITKEESEQDEDDEDEDEDEEPLFSVAPLLRKDTGDRVESTTMTKGTVLSIRLENCGLKGAALEALAHGVRSSALKHISLRRNKITPLNAVSLSMMIRDYPVASDSTHLIESTTTTIESSPEVSSSLFNTGSSQGVRSSSIEESAVAIGIANEREAWMRSEARNKLKKQIDDLPRSGSLLTLDVKGNDLKNGVVYIAQVLKRNRTLKVLNLSENKIDALGLISIAEALKFNATLETLDMSRNPCCVPLDGITALRTAITINTHLKRIFLNKTELNSEGAIALAEVLPETTSLIHLDLTDNVIEISGVLALSIAMKMNQNLRCLDLNIPPNEPEFSHLSQSILESCVRNTEKAEVEGGGKSLSKLIITSVVASQLKKQQELVERHRGAREAESNQIDEIIDSSRESRVVLSELLASDEQMVAQGIVVVQSELVREMLLNAQLAEAQLAEAVAVTSSGSSQRQNVMSLADEMTALLDRAKRIYDPPTAAIIPSPPLEITSTVSSIIEPSSPTFSMDDSDLDSITSLDSLSTSTATPPPAHNSIAIPPRLNEREGFEAGGAAGSPRSPSEHSRSFTIEEGEVFRRRGALNEVANSIDDEREGEELKKKLLAVEFERTPRVVPVEEEMMEGVDEE